MKNPEILLINNEPEICKVLKITLQSNGYKVTQANSAQEGMLAASVHQPDLILMDMGLPDKNSQDVLHSLREWYNKPVIIISERYEEEGIVKALDNGANDYLLKPLRTAELFQRIKIALGNTSADDGKATINRKNLEIDLDAKSVKKAGETIKLTATEFKLLALLLKNEGRILTHQFLLRQIWGPGYIGQSQYLKVIITQLRKKIEPDPVQPEFIVTASGIGYRFECKS